MSISFENPQQHGVVNVLSEEIKRLKAEIKKLEGVKEENERLQRKIEEITQDRDTIRKELKYLQDAYENDWK